MIETINHYLRVSILQCCFKGPGGSVPPLAKCCKITERTAPDMVPATMHSALDRHQKCSFSAGSSEAVQYDHLFECL